MIGRTNEINELNRLYEKNTPELVSVYGRRRVGKTYLINQVFKDRFAFRHAGVSPAENDKKGALKTQLYQFYLSLCLYGMKPTHCPKNWQEAFYMLENLLVKSDDGSRQVVFIDELPWLDTPRSNFISAFESFWNGWGSSRDNLMLIICGSATSWMQDKLINNYGGLYNRITCQLKIMPFTLRECEEYFESNHIAYSRYDIVSSYMTVGGIPYYLDYMRSGKSLAANIDSMFFATNAPLKDEYGRLFASIFAEPARLMSIVELLYTKHIGFTRKEISEKLKITSSGNLTRDLDVLIQSGFVTKYVPFSEGKRNEKYKLVDPFCLFYLRFVKYNNSISENFWETNLDSQKIVTWRGLAFENVCLTHIEEIKSALGIQGVRTNHSSWIKHGTEETDGTQIDLVIERNDNVVNMCEMKFYSDDYRVTKEYDRLIKRRHNTLKEHLPKKASVYNTLITTYGVAKNEYSGSFVNVITIDDLFD